MSPSLSLLLLLLVGLSQANPLIDEGAGDEMPELAAQNDHDGAEEAVMEEDQFDFEDEVPEDDLSDDQEDDDDEVDDVDIDSIILSTNNGSSELLMQEDPYDFEEEVEEDDLIDYQMAGTEDMDISSVILSTNNGSSEILLEGDLVAPKTRNAMSCWNSRCLWRRGSDGLVQVPYTISRAFSNSDRQKISRGLNSFHKSTCIRFVARRRQRDYISIQSRDGCFSSLGRTGGRQVLSLNRRGCVQHGVIQHEMKHALGFNHEQTRSDRDKYVRINWGNIRRSMAYNFYKKNTNNLGTRYDYTSIMHYGRTAFAIRRGVDTITPIPNRRVRIGQRRGMSRTDIKRVNKLYKCRM